MEGWTDGVLGGGEKPNTPVLQDSIIFTATDIRNEQCRQQCAARGGAEKDIRLESKGRRAVGALYVDEGGRIGGLFSRGGE